MSYGEQQKKEIETITERTITVKLSDTDCEKLVHICGEHNLTVGQLIGNSAVLTPTEAMKEILQSSGSSVAGLECFQRKHY